MDASRQSLTDKVETVVKPESEETYFEQATDCFKGTKDSVTSAVQPQQEKSTTCYPSGHHPSVLRSHKWRTAANSAAYLLPHLKPDMHILDIGCGPGTITVDLADHIPQGIIVGIEPSGEVLNQAREHAKQRNVKNARFQKGDIHHLMFADDIFDVVHVHQVLQHVGDPVHALTEMRRVLKPGGIIAARESDFSIMTWYPSSNLLTRWQELWIQVARKNGGEPNAGRRLHAWAREAGFGRKDVVTSTGTWCYRTEEEIEWWSGLWAERVLAEGFRETALKSGFTSEEELERLSAGWREWGKEEDAWFTLVHGEILAKKV